METYTFKYHLYDLFDRAFEDCYALITVNVPVGWKSRAPKEEEVSLAKIDIEKDTMSYLKGTYCTSKDDMISRISEAFEGFPVYDVFIEEAGDNLFPEGDDTKFERWYETASQREWEPTGRVEVMNAQDVLEQMANNLLESAKPQ